jgi:hypothetical protein
MTSDEAIQRRNKRLLNFFIDSGIPVRLIGDDNCPAVVYKEKYVLSCYVKNFDLIFTDKPKEGSEVTRVKLQQGVSFPKEDLVKLLDNCEHRKVYRVKVKGTSLFLSGYNFLDKQNSEGRYPVFSKFGSKIYFSQEYAEQICADYAEYDLEIV